MRPLLITALLSLALPGLALAQTPIVHAKLIPDDGPSQPSMIACTYNAAGDYSGADGANPGEKAGHPVKIGQGNEAWRQVIAAPDGRACPRHIQVR